MSKYYSDPRFWKLPTQERTRVLAGELSLDDYEFTNLDTAAEELAKRQQPALPEFTPQEEGDNSRGLGAVLSGSLDAAGTSLGDYLPSIAPTIAAESLASFANPYQQQAVRGALSSLFVDGDAKQNQARALQRLTEAQMRTEAAKEGMVGAERFVADLVSSAPSAAASVLPLAGGLAVGALSRSPVTGLATSRALAGVPATMAYADAFATAKREGKDDEFAHKYAAAQAGLEYAFEGIIPGAGKTVAGTMAKRAGGEALGEGATTAYQDLLDRVVLPEAASQSAGEAAYNIGLASTAGGLIATPTSRIGAKGDTQRRNDADALRKAEQDRIAAQRPQVKLTGDPVVDEARTVATTLATQAENQVKDLVTPGTGLSTQVKPEVFEGDFQEVNLLPETFPETQQEPEATPAPEQPQTQPTEALAQPETDLDQEASPEEVEALRTEIDMEAARTQREQRVRETLANRQIEGVDVYFDPAVREDGTVQYGRFNPETGRTEINAAQLEDEGDIVAVSVHEIAHNVSQAKDEGTQVSRRDLSGIIGRDQAPAVNARIQNLAQSSPIFKRAVERANASNNPEAEMLSYALEEINRAREADQPLGRRVTQFVKDTVATIKGGLARAGFVDLSKSFNENDLYRLGKVMTSEYGKGLRAKGRGGAGPTLESFGGVKAKNAPLQDYARAEELEIAGATPRQIWSETGWRRGVDDKWRFEIDDSRAKFTPEWDSLGVADKSVRTQKPLGKILDHDGILKNYPQLQKLPILKEKMPAGRQAYFMPGLDGQPGYIAINPNLTNKQALNVLLHEAQHAIQMVENFTQGGTGEGVWQDMSAEERATSKEHAGKFLETRRAQNKEKLDGLRKKDPESLSKVEKKSLEVLKKNILKDTNDLRSLAAGDEAVLKNALKDGNFLHDAYMRIAGEAEARNTQERQMLTEGERREVFPTETQDVPDAELTISGKPARGEQRSEEVLESRAAPTKKEKKVTGKEQQKTERVQPEGEVDRLSTRSFENVPGAGKAPKKTVKTTASRVEKALRYSNKTIANMLGSLGGRNVEIVEILESQKGSSAEALFDAVQSENRLNKAVFKFKDKGKRGEVLRNLAQASSEKKADRDVAREWLKTNAPSVYLEYTRARNAIRFLGIQIAQNILYSGRPLTNREVSVVKAIQRNADNYLNRSYKAYARSGVVRQEWRKYIMSGVEKAKKTGEPNDASNIYEGAVEAAKRNYLDISNFLETTKEDATGFRNMGIEEIKALADVWLGHDAPPLNAEMTPEQRDTFIEDVSQRLNDKWEELQANGTYAQKLNSKAEESIQKLIGVISDGDSAFSKMIRGVTVDRTIITKKQFVPNEIRKVLGEIVNPMSQIANTRMLMAEFVAAQKAMSSLYDIGTANKWVVPPDQSDADTYTSKFPDVREKYGNLAGMAATEDFHKAVVTVSEMNASIRDAILYGDRPDEAVVDMLKDKWTGLTSMTKMMSVAYNAMNPIFNFGGGALFTPIMNGYAVASPGKQNREALAFAAKAVFSSLNTDKRESMTKEFRTILQSGLQDAIEVQELQEGARNELRDELLDSISKDITEEKKPIREFMKSAASFTAKKLPVWATAESDRVWVYYAFKREEQMLSDYYDAKGMDISPEELRMQAAARIKQANINPQRSGKLIKGLERAGLTQYMNYFAETYKTIGRSQWLALKDMQQALKDARDGNTKAARIIGLQGVSRFIGTGATVFANQAMMIGIREAAKAAGLLMVLGTAFSDDDEEQETIEALKKMMPLDEQGKTWMVVGQKGNTYYLQDANRFDPLEPASAPLQSIANGDFEKAYEQAKSVVFQNALLVNMWNAVTEGDKKASMAYSHPAVYDKIMRGTEDTIRSLGVDDPQMAKDIVNGFLKPARVLTPRFTWDWMNRYIAEDSPEQDIEGNSALIGAIRKSGGYVVEADPRRMLSRAVYSSSDGNGFKQVRDQLRKDLTTVLAESPEDITKVVASKMAQEANAFKKLRNVYEGASAIYGEERINELNAFLKDQISDNRVYDAVVDGEYRSTLLSKKVIDGLIQFIDSKDMKPEEKKKQKEQLQRIYDVYASDPRASDEPKSGKKSSFTFL
jgi:hypothetical protein